MPYPDVARLVSLCKQSAGKTEAAERPAGTASQGGFEVGLYVAV